MTSRNAQGQSWFRLPINWDSDEDLIELPATALVLFVKVVEFCHTMQSDGSLTYSQLQSLSSSLSRGRQSVDRLLASGALVADSPLSHGRIPVRIRNAARWLPAVNPPKTISAGQSKNDQRKEVKPEPRGGARVKRERETEREEGRTPSGSVRPSSAQAAPRVAGGATQPAPTPESPEVPTVGTMSGAEARAAIRAQLTKAKQTVPGSTGRDTKFSKYDPDRPITPINSAMAAGWDSE